jgi:hypothetical protein
LNRQPVTSANGAGYITFLLGQVQNIQPFAAGV